MCGIVGVVRRRSTRSSPDLRALVKTLEAVAGRAQSWAGDAEVLVDIATAIVDLDAQLRGIPGIRSLIDDDQSRAELSHTAQKLSSDLDGIERSLDAGTLVVASSDLEVVNSALVQAKDGAWAIHADRVRTAEAVAGLARGAGKNEIGEAALEAYASIQIALAGIDRLEVRGRDSAGLHVLIRNSGLSDKDRVDIEKSDRSDIRFGNRTIRFSGDAVGFVYKFAAEIGDLGDNTCRLRHDIENDAILRQALSSDSAEAIILGHTRWASVGIISEFNTHPLDSLEITQPSKKEKPAPYVVAALNGDVDNFVELSSEKNFAFSPEITTDAKAIPVLVARNEIKGDNPQESFRAAVNTLEGSVAIGAALATAPEQLFLALRGSGQALYVGLAEDAFIIASEPYGIVEETSDYLRLDGESVSDSSRANATRGQIVVLDADQAGEISGINRYSYDGSELLLEPQEIERAEITTRDINRGAAPHFLLKEITESPASLRKTLRGRIVENAGLLEVALGDDAMPEKVRKRLASGSIRKVVVIGQGTAAVAGRAVAATLLDANTELVVSSTLATELSGFSVRDDMSDTLVVAISQSGTTTDTNRTVDVVRDRGAAVISIVNRRKSDLVEKSDGVLYTSDGRDVEMSVASTKAFYAQVAAGVLLALAIADSAGRLDPTRVNQWLTGLRALPLAMEKVLESRAAIAAVAQRHAPRLRYWAVVGNGVNKTAANEIRIKLSELCYKAIAVDVTEDKKHIDLSSEPLIVVCAAGLGGSIADDVSKEVAI
ncbi:MAG: SIS domain-containing protein, partial [Actinobacteria bacterium]|nr:SIS domain-containing protein [Actinomycetota bacterium]